MTDRPVPYRLVTDRLVLRALELTDATEMHAAVARNREYLAQWMPWARSELTLDGYIQHTRSRRAAFDRSEDFSFGIFDGQGGELIGSAGLHSRCGPGGLEIGYWVAQDRSGQGLATEATAALTQVAFDHFEAQRVELRVQEEHTASRRIAEKLGFSFEGVLRRRLEFDGQWEDMASYCILPEEVAESAVGSFSYRAFDGLGRPIPAR